MVVEQSATPRNVPRNTHRNGLGRRQIRKASKPPGPSQLGTAVREVQRMLQCRRTVSLVSDPQGTASLRGSWRRSATCAMAIPVLQAIANHSEEPDVCRGLRDWPKADDSSAQRTW